MRIVFVLGIVATLFVTGNISAQTVPDTSQTAPQPNPSNCGNYRDPNSVRSSMEVVRQFTQGNKSSGSMEEFIEALPDSVRGNFIFMGQSQSFQTATPDNPRVIMSSPSGDIRFSFTADPNARGGDKIEISIWNPQKKAYDYQEIEFGSGGNSNQFHDDPASCKNCHGNPERPNWDNYNFWAGAIPMSKDALVKGSWESEQYIRLLNDNNPRLRALQRDLPGSDQDRTESNLRAQMDSKFGSSGNKFMTLEFVNDAGTGTQLGNAGGLMVNIFDNMVSRQACTAQDELKKSPEWGQVGFLVAGLREGCNNLADFVPPEFANAAALRFKRERGMSNGYNLSSTPSGMPPSSSQIGSVWRDVIADTDRRQTYQIRDKLGRQTLMLEEGCRQRPSSCQSGGNARARARAELRYIRNNVGISTVSGSGGESTSIGFTGATSDYQPRSTIGENPNGVGTWRYFLEPLGVNMQRWSGSIDETTYTFSDLWGTFTRNILSNTERNALVTAARAVTVLTPGITAESSRCEVLAAASKMSLTGPDNTTAVGLVSTNRQFCEQVNTGLTAETEATRTLSQFSYSRAKAEAREAIESEMCAMCHTADQNLNSGRPIVSDGTPAIPFNDMNKLGCLVRANRGSPINIGNRIWNRITRHSSEMGQMPRNMGAADADSKLKIRRWLEKEWARGPQSGDSTLCREINPLLN